MWKHLSGTACPHQIYKNALTFMSLDRCYTILHIKVYLLCEVFMNKVGNLMEFP
jgi:hypothetical protein